MVLWSIQCDFCGHHFRIPASDIRNTRSTYCINCAKLVTVDREPADDVRPGFKDGILRRLLEDATGVRRTEPV